MVNLTDLPTEILRQIAYYVKYEDVQTLKSASRVCRCLTSAFQEDLFPEINLENPAATDRFEAIIWTSPHLISYIQSFSVSLSHEDLVVRVLSNASKIKKLRFNDDNCRGDSKVYDTQRWYAYKTDTRTTTESTLGKLPLNEIYFDRVPIPLSLLAQCRRLQHLSLANIKVEPKDLPCLGNEEQSISLRTLQLRLDSETLSLATTWLVDPQCIFDISHLESLYLNSDLPHAFDGTYFWDIMQKCALSVEILGFDLITSDDSPPLIDLSIFPKLQQLKIRTAVTESNKAEVWTKHALDNIPTNNSLRNIFVALILPEEELYYNIPPIYRIFLGEAFSDAEQGCVRVYEPIDSDAQDGVLYELIDQDIGIDGWIELEYCHDDPNFLFLEFS
ncbi:hypothetical protein BDQ17DRAFT_1541838 [Cyathus striatus]|nr:hypothetical protein BDQ17DRAFT_1541838 [Cyathus striatus]